ncbi:Imm45 family immunity protein [Xenorhabdus sp. XENO-10]|uniref:Imm45 family immunity protein n=1 Tax=Xenorhabdus yunnanensis TaxID=3025878 RepID=A0ABT5LIT4_9GAMM|nr:Imm45 family immunity protein [Xenorhabdus yunnanensis]MDC9591021.1 Imm45 family immunity protein [Xenorhabdus yunnanensis]
MVKLIDYEQDGIGRGCVFRFPAVWPYEEFVDLLVINFPNPDKDTMHALVISTGHKAGSLLVELPKESELTNSVGLKKEWIISNWAEWIYPECDVNDVYIIRRYSPPTITN